MGLTYSSVVDAGRDEVFSWHARPGAIARLTPPWQPVTVLREAGSLRDGRAILRLPGGLRWVAAHQPGGYDPPDAFADELTSLPLPWRHTHQFSPVGEAATLVTDVVETPLPARVLRSMFIYRHRQLAADLAALARARAIGPDPGPLTIAVTGSSGLIGTALTALLTTSGHRVVPLVRRLPEAGQRYWRPDDPAPELLDGVDAVIHLAGASIGGRFTAERKHEIRASRIQVTRKLAELAAVAPDLKAFVTASAIGIYGADRGEEILTEASPRGDGFLADVVAGWEDAAAPAAAAGIRAVLDPGLSGPVNAVAPEPARNIDYTRTLAAVLRRPAVLPVPELGPRLLLGDEGAREIAQASQYVRPERLIQAGHRFRQPELTGALRHLFGREGA
jgi:NAD dependent epimerase/dehydratase family enzyme/ligand-binding SRPBCC domain-containing protein